VVKPEAAAAKPPQSSPLPTDVSEEARGLKLSSACSSPDPRHNLEPELEANCRSTTAIPTTIYPPHLRPHLPRSTLSTSTASTRLIAILQNGICPCCLALFVASRLFSLCRSCFPTLRLQIRSCDPRQYFCQTYTNSNCFATGQSPTCTLRCMYIPPSCRTLADRFHRAMSTPKSSLVS